jgi:hypothetical protein
MVPSAPPDQPAKVRLAGGIVLAAKLQLHVQRRLLDRLDVNVEMGLFGVWLRLRIISPRLRSPKVDQFDLDEADASPVLAVLAVQGFTVHKDGLA